jgi:hypothetical protein
MLKVNRHRQYHTKVITRPHIWPEQIKQNKKQNKPRVRVAHWVRQLDYLTYHQCGVGLHQLCKLQTRGSQEPVIAHLVFNLTGLVITLVWYCLCLLTFSILIYLSQTTGPIWTKLGRNVFFCSPLHFMIG